MQVVCPSSVSHEGLAAYEPACGHAITLLGVL